MWLLKLINFLNFKWNNFIGWIHDVSARMGVGHLTVWFYDAFIWNLPNKWTLVGGMRYDEYLLQHELDLQRHQTQYFANYAYDLLCEILESIVDTEELSSQKEAIISSKNINFKEEAPSI